MQIGLSCSMSLPACTAFRYLTCPQMYRPLMRAGSSILVLTGLALTPSPAFSDEPEKKRIKVQYLSAIAKNSQRKAFKVDIYHLPASIRLSHASRTVMSGGIRVADKLMAHLPGES